MPKPLLRAISRATTSVVQGANQVHWDLMRVAEGRVLYVMTPLMDPTTRHVDWNKSWCNVMKFARGCGSTGGSGGGVITNHIDAKTSRGLCCVLGLYMDRTDVHMWWELSLGRGYRERGRKMDKLMSVNGWVDWYNPIWTGLLNSFPHRTKLSLHMNVNVDHVVASWRR